MLGIIELSPTEVGLTIGLDDDRLLNDLWVPKPGGGRTKKLEVLTDVSSVPSYSSSLTQPNQSSSANTLLSTRNFLVETL